MVLGHAIYRRTDPETGRQYAGKVWWTKPNWTAEKACARRWSREDKGNGMTGWHGEIVSSEKRSDVPHMSDGLYHIRIAVNEGAEFDKIPPEKRKNKIHPLLQLSGASANESSTRLGGHLGGRKVKELGVGIFAPEMRGVGGRIGGRKNVESGHLRSVSAKAGRLGGLKTMELYGNPGTPEGRTKGGRLGSRNQPYEEKVRGGRIAGRITKEKGTGLFVPGYLQKGIGGRATNETTEGRKGNGGRIGGPIGSRITNCVRWKVNRGLPCVCGHHRKEK